MIKYSIKRIFSLIPVIFAISLVLFGLTKLMPGDQVAMMIPPNTRPDRYQEVYQQIEQNLGLDKPVPVQYAVWMKNMATGDMGYSTVYNRPVNTVIANPLRNTVILNFFVLLFSLTISILAGIHSAIKRGSLIDQFWQIFSLVGMSVPSFFIALCLIFVFSFTLKWLPSGGMPTQNENFFEWVRYLALPVITLTVVSLASTIRYVRNAMLDVLSQDYIRTARSKGLSEKVVIYSHAFRNALIPVVTIVIAQIGGLFSGSMITEQVFSWDGLGKVLVTALNRRDSMLVISLNMFYVIIYLASNFLCDITYAMVDPRIKLD